jgi:hypothetical protein
VLPEADEDDMATKVETVTKDLYEEDFYVWVQRQAELLRSSRFDELDLEHLVDEVEDLAILAKSSVLNNARVVMEHLLKLQHSPAQPPRRLWEASVFEHRSRLEIELTPGVRRLLDEHVDRIYQMARRNTAAALRRYGENEAADRLPAECPYSLDQVLGDWLP